MAMTEKELVKKVQYWRRQEDDQVKVVQAARRELERMVASRDPWTDKSATHAQLDKQRKVIAAEEKKLVAVRVKLAGWEKRLVESRTGYVTIPGGARATRETAAVLDYARKKGWKGKSDGPVSGLRTYAEQKALWDAYQNGTGSPAFPPDGPSLHMVSNLPKNRLHAVDMSDAARFCEITGWRRPYNPPEFWHVEK